jgi:Cytochrome P450
MEVLLNNIIVRGLAGIAGLFVLSIVAHKVLIRQRSDEPPIHKGWIPWYGVYFEMDKNPEKLLTRLRKKYGEIFSVWTAGTKMTICLDILEGIPGMYRNTKQMEFHEFERQLQAPVFGFPLDFRDNLELQGELHTLTNVYTIKSDSVVWLAGQFQTALDELLNVELKKRDGQDFVVDMTMWGRYVMYAASLKSLLGLHFPSQEEEMFKDFLAWEWDFVNMSKGKPHYTIKKGWDARERIFKRIAKEMAEYEDLVTPFIKQRIDVSPKNIFSNS